MADESSIRAALVATGAYTALIGGATPRHWDQQIPSSFLPTPDRPYVIQTTVSDVALNVIEGTQLGGMFRLQFDIYADTKESAKAVLAQLRAALAPYGYEEIARDLPAGAASLRRISVDWRIVIAR